MLGQYSRLASLFEHNVALVLLGDDFRYDHALEWEQQYANYKKIMDYVNDNGPRFGDTHMMFGTLADYWNEVYKRQKEFPTLSGDFMPYGDVYSEGLPNYWTGYYTTRPFLKRLSREVQHFLRAAEILYALGRYVEIFWQRMLFSFCSFIDSFPRNLILLGKMETVLFRGNSGGT